MKESKVGEERGQNCVQVIGQEMWREETSWKAQEYFEEYVLWHWHIADLLPTLHP